MRSATVVAVLAAVALCFLEGATSAAVGNPHRHASRRGHVVRLQETVDRLLLRQKTDHILLQNLQEAVLKLQKEDRSSSTLPEAVEAVEAEGRVLANLGVRVAEVTGSLKEAIKGEGDHDEVDQLRQEVAYLRSEVQRLKTAQASVPGTNQGHLQAQEHREAVTSAWVVDNVRRLQDSLVEIQQAINVSQAMHDKMEVESRLLTVTKDVGALRGTVAALTSKAEAALATAGALQQEVGRVTEEANKNAGHLGTLQAEVTSIRADFNDLLTALPEGTMARQGTSVQQSDNEEDKEQKDAEPRVVPRKSPSKETQRLDALERRANEFDFAITRVEKQLASSSSSSPSPLPASHCEERVSQLEETRRQLETQVEDVQSGVGEVRSSSVQLLASLEALEARLEKEVSEVKQEVAKVEFNAAQAAADHKANLDNARVALDDATALRTDLEAVSRRLDHLTLKTVGLDSAKLEGEVSSAECHSKHAALEMRVSGAEDRLSAFEEQLRETIQGRRRRHR